MIGQVVLSSGISHHSERVPVRERIRQITDEILSTRDHFICESPGVKFPSINNELMRDLSRKIVREILSDLASGISATPVLDGAVSDKPMTQEQMAVAIARDMKGTRPLSPQNRRKINTAFYVSIKKMIYQLATRYSATCPDAVDDLAQDCFYRILSKLVRFEPKKGKFTTWTWSVCRNVLNKKYRSGQRRRQHIVSLNQPLENGNSWFENRPERPIEGVQHHECPGIMAVGIMDAVRCLASKHPAKKRLIFEIFGNPDSEDFVMPSYVSISEAAKAVGMEYSRARVFYGSVVRPFLQKQLAGC